jgi:predicted glycosyltransferase
MTDYEHAQIVPFARPKWMIIPEALSRKNFPLKFYYIRQYPGIKEDVYVPDFRPNPLLKKELGLRDDDINITVRPPADEAHYHNTESDRLLMALMTRIGQTPGIRAILLPRNQRQEQFLRASHPDWFGESKAIVPSRAVDGLNLLWYSDLVVSGGGTMNREAAALGIPVYSIFRGRIGAIDRMLEQEGRLIMIQNTEDIWTKIRFERRQSNVFSEGQPRPGLAKIVDHIENIIVIERARTRKQTKRA